MTKKLFIVAFLSIALVGLALTNFVRSSGNPAKYVIENFSGVFNDNGDNSTDLSGSENLGAIEFNTGKTTFNELANSVLKRNTITVSAAQIDDLRTHPVTLVPAVGTDQVIVVQEITGFRRFSSESWNRGNNESFEVKWASSQTATGSLAGAAGNVALGASFSTGFLTGDALNSQASRSVEVWKPSGLLVTDDGPSSGIASNSYQPSYYASSSAVLLTGLVNPSNVETSGITDFVFEVVYRILTRP